MRSWLVLVGCVGVLGCAADAEAIEGALVVEEAGLATSLVEGTECHFRLRPAWRQGVNCQLEVTCPAAVARGPDESLFGGRLPGGYARCDTADHAFTRALDDDPRDGDPAIDLDLARGTLSWRGRSEELHATLRVVDEPRPSEWTDP